MLQIFPEPSFDQTKTWRFGSFGDHPCKRACHSDQKPMTCYYYLIIHNDEIFNPSCERYLDQQFRFRVNGREYIDTFAVKKFDGFDDCKYGDGEQMGVQVVNGQLPGQTIEVCQGDTIVADVINSLHDITTLHWHGLHQLKTPHMDGVPYITQYPIEPGQAFRYSFEADNFGTHWWHSHVGHQRGRGIAGALVVRQAPSEDMHGALYDFDHSEHTIMLQDWLYDGEKSAFPANILIDGVGRKADGRTKNKSPTLYATYTVLRGGRYRFRVIFNGIANCPISMSIDNHELIVISSDGNDIVPVKVRKITLHGGERFDFILHANQKVENYWIRVKGYAFCSTNKVHQEAILHYDGAKQRTLPKGKISYEYEPNGKELNPINQPPTADNNLLTIADLEALERRSTRATIPYRTYYTSMSIRKFANEFLFQMDEITFALPPRMSLLQSRNLGVEQFLCNKTQQATLGLDCRGETHCKCANIIEVPAFKHIEFVISSTSETAHPIHLHGYTFRVIGIGVLGADKINQIEEIDRRTPLPRRERAAPIKDTVQVPAFGYTIIRFYTDNPGYWILHCHISTHSEMGMAAVIRVGDHKQMKTCPVSNCGLCKSVL
ncbi:laccase-3 [Ceratitis capitata]|uniref:laccase-3 n=1 Tax=Ceratitis capitata TaxID=7213 RepID=UPI000329755C|nr:laccase-3 [Ceratitis capitata]